MKELGLGNEGLLLLRSLTGRKGNNHKQIGVRGCPSTKGRHLPFWGYNQTTAGPIIPLKKI